jgi:hypothetical protein
MPDVGEAVDGLVSMLPQSSNVCYSLEMETMTASGDFGRLLSLTPAAC